MIYHFSLSDKTINMECKLVSSSAVAVTHFAPRTYHLISSHLYFTD